MSGKIVVFGAGATGRGHVGLLAHQAGYRLVFVDRNQGLVETLRRAGCYHVRLYGEGGPSDVMVAGYRIYDAADRETVAAEILDADLVLTAVFDQNLPDVAETLVLAVRECRAAGRSEPLNCIACENMMDSSSALGGYVRSHLSGPDAAYHELHFAYPDCMISRVVPRPEPDPLFIVTEDYNEWTARAEAFRGPKPQELRALELVDNQTARLERKLFIHNGGHAICGYTGFQRGHRYIHEAVADPVVAGCVLPALDEIGEVVRRKHGFAAADIDAYKLELVQRGSIPEMRDEIARVVRDPIRKLSPRERLLAPALLAGEYGLPRGWIVKGIVAALRCYNPDDPQSVSLAAMLAEGGLRQVLSSVCRLDPRDDLAREIQVTWDTWSFS